MLIFISYAAASTITVSGVVLNDAPGISGLYVAKADSNCTASDFASEAISTTGFVPGTDYLCLRVEARDSSGNRTISLSDSNFVVAVADRISEDNNSNSWDYIRISTDSVGFADCSTGASKTTMANSDESFCAQISPGSVSISLSSISKCAWSVKAVVQDTNAGNAPATQTVSNAVAFSTSIANCASASTPAATVSQAGGGTVSPPGSGGLPPAKPVERKPQAAVSLEFPAIESDQTQKITISVSDENVSVSGVSVFMIFPDGHVEKLPVSEWEFEFKPSGPGAYTVLIKYVEITTKASFTVTPAPAIVKRSVRVPGTGIAVSVPVTREIGKKLDTEDFSLLWVSGLAVFMIIFYRSRGVFALKRRPLLNKALSIPQKTAFAFFFAFIAVMAGLLLAQPAGVLVSLLEVFGVAPRLWKAGGKK
ncbi:MAG: hypothetical protein HY394_02805 [Candidatus Diapherotrites archaeon]|nr:hypothetical protein [Candidatus Diapherotrites archaeon]